MARDDKEMKKVNRKIQNLASGVQDNMDDLYRTTYFSTPQASNDVKDITKSINDNIDDIVNRNMSSFGMPSVSVLYQRMINKTNEKSPADGINKMFEDPMMMDDLYSTFMSNRFIRELDDEIDTVCKYMPELEEALDTKKDSVLSADHFSKDFLNIKFPTDIDNETFSQRITELKKKYKLQKLAEEIYQDTSKYGEKFTYCVPYSIAISRLLMNKPKTSLVDKPVSTRMESTVFTESEFNDAVREGSEFFLFKMDSSKAIITNNASDRSSIELDKPDMIIESTSIVPGSYKKKTITEHKSILDDNQSFNIAIEINNTGIIDSAVKEMADSLRISNKRVKSLKESFTESVRTPIAENNKIPNASGNLNFNNVFKRDKTVNDGLITGGNDTDIKNYQVTAPGAVVKHLEREYVLPCYIEKSCMGYYFIELRTKDLGDEMMGFRNLLGDPMTNMSSEGRHNFNNVDANRQDETLKYVSSQLSKFIDKKFVNANQDLAKEIYEILKYNDLFNTPSIDLIKVTFIPPEDIHHSYFRFDDNVHRGVSDLARGLIPAKLYSSLYITNSIGVMTRGQDKRVYYVKQMVDTNIAQQLMNVINQIKMGNFGIRQFNSINNILNITGKFNDYVIPTSPSGDAPINVDIIQGQQFDIHTDLMDILKEMAINSTDVPLEIIQTRQSVDYAMQLSMSSSKFLRTVYKRQDRFQEILSPLITAIYNYEYNENVDLEVTLPPPVFLDMANTNQLINNTRDFVDSIIDIEMQEEQDATLKSRYRDNLFMHYIGTHIDISAHKHILEKTRTEIKMEQKESEIATPEEPSDNSYDSWS